MMLYSVDSLAWNERAVFGYGWIISERSEIDSVSLLLFTEDAEAVKPQETFQCEYPVPRKDVEEYHSQYRARALNSGWRVCGSIAGLKYQRVDIRVKLNDGTEEYIPRVAMQAQLKVPSVSAIESKARWLIFSGRKFIDLIANRKYRYALEKLRSRFNFGHYDKLENQQAYAQLDELEIADAPWVLIVDHDMGGGANKFREEIVRKYLSSKTNVIVLKNNLIKLSLTIDLRRELETKSFSLNRIVDFLLWLSTKKIQALVYNNLVSYDTPFSVLKGLSQLKSSTDAELIIFVHDYFSVCPSPHLINSEGNFCKIPDPAVCALCLSRNRRSFVPLYNRTSIEEWRNEWRQFYAVSDKIICFSASSKVILENVFGSECTSDKLEVRPHVVAVSGAFRMRDVPSAAITVGVVGHINFEKGAHVIERIVDYLESARIDGSVVVIGSLESGRSSSRLKITGPYRPSDLAEWLDKTNVNICLVPSICPETFSYVSQELIELGVPVASFDLGAPPERIRAYAKGHVLRCSPEADGGEIWSELEFFNNKVSNARGSRFH